MTNMIYNNAELFSLKDKVIIVTGAAGLLGEMHTHAVLEAGGIPVMLDIDASKLECLSKKLYDKAVQGYACSVTDQSALEQILADLDKRYGRIDGLINNACYNPTMKGVQAGAGRIETISKAQWDMELDVGLFGAFCCSRVFGQYMSKHGGGSIVNISSDLGVIAPNQSLYLSDQLTDDEQPKKPVTYSVIKWGLIGMTKYFSTYWASQGVRANAVALGGVYNQQDDVFLNRIAQLIPMGRMAEKEEYMGTIVYMLSKASSYMTGAVISVDGGRTAW